LSEGVHHAGDAQTRAAALQQEVPTIWLAAVLGFADEDVHGLKELKLEIVICF
jgi:hypothetical protein